MEEYNKENGKELFNKYLMIKELGGNLLVNFGPDKNGNISRSELKSINDFISLKNQII